MWETAFAVYTRFGQLKEWKYKTSAGWMRELIRRLGQNGNDYIVIQADAVRTADRFPVRRWNRGRALMATNPLWGTVHPWPREIGAPRG